MSQLQVRQVQVSQVRVHRVRAGRPASPNRPSPAPAGRAPAGAGPASRAQAGLRRARAGAGRPGPVRLTRRGRTVLAVLAILATLAVLALLWLSVAGGAQAADRGQRAGSPYQGMTQVVVRPGQTLWSIAAAAEPAADPRVVAQQIMEVNALSGATIQAGQLLWVPRG
ncbi:MAG TPA: LysM peptidoglycan-binding domain-containing protein [Streptosporangiaceae bacterium]